MKQHLLVLWALLIAFAVQAIPASDGFDFPIGTTGNWPTSGGWYVSRDFNVWVDDGIYYGYHLGEDISIPGDTDIGQPVYAASTGTVIMSGSAGGWGNYVIIRHQLPNGELFETLYGHLQNVTVYNGQNVTRRQQIAQIGPHSGGAHLHFEVRVLGCPDWGVCGTGYRTSISGWTDPTNFINNHRPSQNPGNITVAWSVTPFNGTTSPLPSGYIFWYQPYTVSGVISNLPSGYGWAVGIYSSTGTFIVAPITNQTGNTFSFTFGGLSTHNATGLKFKLLPQYLPDTPWESSASQPFATGPYPTLNLGTLASSYVQSNNINLTWSVSGGITGLTYGGWNPAANIRLQWYQGSTPLTNICSVPLTDWSATFTADQSPGTGYRVGVANIGSGSALPDGIPSAYSSTFSIVAQTLNPPSGLTATVLSNGSVSLSWNAPTGTGLSGYRVYRNNVNISPLISATAYTDAFATSGSTYQYHVVAVFTTGVSGASNTVTITVPAANVFPAPGSLTASSYPGKVILSWQQPSGQASGTLSTYKVYRNSTYLALTTALSYQDNASPGTTYTYYITASYINPAGESAPSNSVVATPGYSLEPPVNLTVGLENNDAVLNWIAPQSSGLAGFKLYRDSVPLTVINDPSQITYTDADLNPGVYTYDVSSLYVTGQESSLSNSVTITVTGTGGSLNLLSNGGFELGASSGWLYNHSLNGSVTVIEDGDCVEGSHKAVFSNPNPGSEWLEEAFQVLDVTLESSKVYDLSFYCKNNEPQPTTAYLIIMKNTEPYNSFGFWVPVLVTDTWRKHQYRVVVNQTAVSARVNWQLGSTRSFELDACSLTEIQPVEPVLGNQILNGDFETISWDPWVVNDAWIDNSTPGPSFYYIDSSTAGSGSQSIFFQPSVLKPVHFCQVLQPVTLIAGVSFTLTFKARGTSTRSISVETHNSTSWENTGLWSTIGLSTNWTTYSFTFTAQESGLSNLVYHLGGSTIGVNLDDVSLVHASTALPGTHPIISAVPNPSKGKVKLLLGGTGKNSDTTLRVYNIKGQMVRDLSEEGKTSSSVVFDRIGKNGKRLAAGVYFIKLETGKSSTVKKIILID